MKVKYSTIEGGDTKRICFSREEILHMINQLGRKSTDNAMLIDFLGHLEKIIVDDK